MEINANCPYNLDRGRAKIEFKSCQICIYIYKHSKPKRPSHWLTTICMHCMWICEYVYDRQRFVKRNKEGKWKIVVKVFGMFA